MNTIHMTGPWITKLEIDTVTDAMTNGWYENPYAYCEKFQKQFAEYHNRKYALMTTNCTSAIHTLLASLGVGPGDEVIAPDCTWIGSTVAIDHLGAKTIFADIDKNNWCLCPDSVEKNISSKTKVIIAVDLFGNMPNFERLEAISKKYNIPLIEDAAEALGSKYKNKKAGTFGVASVFSFHRTKTITTGEGGMMLLDDEELYNKCVLYRDHGRGPKTPMYYNEIIGHKFMPFNVQAAIGYAQMQRLPELIDRKREILHSYIKHLKSVPDLYFNQDDSEVYNGAWITALILGDSYKITKKDFIDKCQKLGAPLRPFFYPLSSIPAYKELVEGENYKTRNINSYHISDKGVNLPSAFNITEEQIIFICDQVKKVLS